MDALLGEAAIELPVIEDIFHTRRVEFYDSSSPIGELRFIHCYCGFRDGAAFSRRSA